MTTPLERFRASVQGQRPDRVPVIPVLHTAAAELIGAAIGEYAASPRTMAETLVAAYRHYGLDGVVVSLGVATEASALGIELVEPEDGLPQMVHPAIHEPADLRQMHCPDPRKDGLMPRFLEGTKRVLDEIGHEACVMAVIRGPLNIAGQLRGIQDLMLDMIDQPDFVTELLVFSNQVARAMGEALVEMGTHVIAIADALCSPSFISPPRYRSFVVDLHRDLCTALHAQGAESILLHICGDITSILPDMLSTGVDIIDLDWQVSVKRARECAGEQVTLRGNLDPIAALLEGTPEKVKELAQSAIREAGSGSRYILGSGCDIAPGTPRENIAALVAAAREVWN